MFLLKHGNISGRIAVVFRTRTSVCHVKLSYDIFSPVSVKKEPLIILHGVLGSRVNWKSMARAISVQNEREVYCLDARNHGESPHTEEFSYDVMAEDVFHFIEDKRLSEVSLLGHSMGGRTAMMLALIQPEVINKLVIVDISPVTVPKSSTSMISYNIKAMKEVLKLLPPTQNQAEARKLANELLQTNILNSSTREFLLMNLVQKNNCFGWKCNIDVIEKYFGSSKTLPFSIPQKSYGKDTLFICGRDSLHVSPDDHQSIRVLFPKAKFVYISGAGHWVHADKPKEFLSEVNSFLQTTH